MLYIYLQNQPTMEINAKKIERSSKIVNIIISLILCFFLILLSNKIISDLDSTIERPDFENFVNKTKKADIDKIISIKNTEIEQLNNQKTMMEKMILTAKTNYENEKQSFDNWIAARKTLQAPDKDKEVIQRAKNIDEYFKVEQSWRLQVDSISNKINTLEESKNELYKENDSEYAVAQKKFDQAYKWFELRVFLVRLLFVLPILGIGVFFFIRFRNHKFSPLFMGFVYFSVYCFFFGLLPYLPSYGGYVHYTVGILLSIGIGYYAIKNLRLYLERKRAELESSSEERAKNVHSETAEKALENHICPSCGKDFFLKKWEHPNTNAENEVFKTITDFCRHCGLVLFKKCEKCSHKNFAHIPYCSNCGTKQGV